ncbi:MAG TPA: cytochrome c biogenesis protein CcdA [Ktedonobacterales bacterium]|jgi:cytochrome c-type biogenesis protein
MPAVGVFGAFLAGLLSFFSPCVLPLTPIYIAQLAGPSVWRTERADFNSSGLRRETLLHAAAYVGGFSLVFIALGATASALGAFLAAHAELLRQIGGALLIVFGLYVAGVLRIPLLDRERRFSLRFGQASYPASFAVGMAFGLGWTPCVGPVLAGILLFAAQAATLQYGVLLLAVYSLGLGIPFLALGIGFETIAPRFKRFSPYLPLIERGTGVLLILMGVVIFFNWLLYLNAWFKPPFL